VCLSDVAYVSHICRECFYLDVAYVCNGFRCFRKCFRLGVRQDANAAWGRAGAQTPREVGWDANVMWVERYARCNERERGAGVGIRPDVPSLALPLLDIVCALFI
jgi:hypothetical protein